MKTLWFCLLFLIQLEQSTEQSLAGFYQSPYGYPSQGVSYAPRRRRDTEDANTEETEETEDQEEDKSDVYTFLYKRMKQEAVDKKKERKKPTPNVYMIPGPQEPLPGRSHIGDYWPVFPFQNQFSGGLDLDPSISRHIGGDLNLAVPSWGILDIYGRFFNRIHDTTTKFGYLNHPVNMLDLEKEDFVKLMSDPSLQFNRQAQPRLPLGKFAKSYVPLNCRPPMCNPYHQNFAFGMEHDYGGNDGVEGDIDVPIPISKGVAYRFPFSGKIYSFFDNITVTYGQNLAPVDPFHSLFDYQKHRDPGLTIPRRRRRDISESRKVWSSEPEAKTYGDHVKSSGASRYQSIFKTKISKPKSTKYDKMENDELQYVTVPHRTLLYQPYMQMPMQAAMDPYLYAANYQNYQSPEYYTPPSHNYYSNPEYYTPPSNNYYPNPEYYTPPVNNYYPPPENYSPSSNNFQPPEYYVPQQQYFGPPTMPKIRPRRLRRQPMGAAYPNMEASPFLYNNNMY